MKAFVVAFLVVAATLLAGCSGGSACYEPTVTLAGGPAKYSTAGDFEIEVPIAVKGMSTNGETEAVPGATVIAYLAVPIAKGVKSGQDAAIAALASGTRTESTERLLFLQTRLVTDSNGRVLLKVPQGSILRAAAAADGWTSEGSERRGGDGDDALGLVVLNLARPAANATGKGLVPAGASADPVYIPWEPIVVPLATGEAKPLYRARMASATATVAWTNDLLHHADFGAGIGSSADLGAEMNYNDQLLTDGRHKESVTVSLGSDGAPMDQTTDVYAGPVLHRHVTHDGIAFDVAVSATFKGLNTDLTACIPSSIAVDGTVGLDDPRFADRGAPPTDAPEVGATGRPGTVPDPAQPSDVDASAAAWPAVLVALAIAARRRATR